MAAAYPTVLPLLGEFVSLVFSEPNSLLPPNIFDYSGTVVAVIESIDPEITPCLLLKLTDESLTDWLSLSEYRLV